MGEWASGRSACWGENLGAPYGNDFASSTGPDLSYACASHRPWTVKRIPPVTTDREDAIPPVADTPFRPFAFAHSPIRRFADTPLTGFSPPPESEIRR